MKVLDPITIDGTTLTSSNVSETVDVYSAGTTYGLGDLVRDDTAHLIYESLQAANTGHALSDAAWWLETGATNKWAMFDNYNETQTSRADSVDVVVTPTGRVDGLALFNLDAATVDVTVTDGVDGVVFSETYSLVSPNNVGDWHDYFFQPIIRETTLLVEGLPLYVGPAVAVTINNAGGMAKCGKMVLGGVRNLGATVYGASIGIIDASRKQTDDFGRTTIVQRSYRRTGSFTVVVEKNMVNEVARLLTERRAIFSVFIGTGEYSTTIINGFPRDWRETIDHFQNSTLTIEIEGIA